MTRREAGFRGYLAVAAFGLTGGYVGVGAGEPIFGWPRPLAYHVGWVVLTFAVLVWFHLTEPDPAHRDEA
ncbi:MAG: hypothetical protein AAGN82_12335 [Myxococcota bacterium]